MHEQEIVPHKGLFIRKDSYDKEIVSEIARSYEWMNPVGEIVLDIGGCFGGYSVMACEQGAKRVFCYEPEPNNFEMVCRNTASLKQVTAINSALVATHQKEISFYLTGGRNNGNYSTTPYRGRKEVRVRAENFHEVLERIKPSTIKMDCEGSEYDLLQKPLPSHVKKITIEIHFGKKGWRTYCAPRLIERFRGWRAVVTPKVGEKNWHTLGSWERE